MPAAGRRDGKYVKRMHYRVCQTASPRSFLTRCGKHMLESYTTTNPLEVTCKTCMLIMDIPVGELDGC